MIKTLLLLFLLSLLTVPLLAQAPLSLNVGIVQREYSWGTQVQLGYDYGKRHAILLRGDYLSFRTENYQSSFVRAEGSIDGVSLGWQTRLLPAKVRNQHRKHWLFGGGVYYRQYRDLHFVAVDYSNRQRIGGLGGGLSGPISTRPGDRFFRDLRLSSNKTGLYLEFGERHRLHDRLALEWTAGLVQPLNPTRFDDSFWPGRVPSSLTGLDYVLRLGLRYSLRGW